MNTPFTLYRLFSRTMIAAAFAEAGEPEFARTLLEQPSVPLCGKAAWPSADRTGAATDRI